LQSLDLVAKFGDPTLALHAITPLTQVASELVHFDTQVVAATVVRVDCRALTCRALTTGTGRAGRTWRRRRARRT
jgi:hypothetical protein